MVQLNFNATGVAPQAALDPLPTGIYPVIITRTEQKPTRAGDGSYIEIEMQVQGGEFANRKVFDRLNIQNKNQVAVDIAYSTLSAICHVTNRLQIQQTEQLHGIPFQVSVKKIPRNDQPDVMTNEVAGYKDINGNDPGKAGNTAAGGTPNWAQNGQPQGQAQNQQQNWQQGNNQPQGGNQQQNQSQNQNQQQNTQPQQNNQQQFQQQGDPNQGSNQQQNNQQGGAPAGDTPPWLRSQG